MAKKGSLCVLAVIAERFNYAGWAFVAMATATATTCCSYLTYVSHSLTALDFRGSGCGKDNQDVLP